MPSSSCDPLLLTSYHPLLPFLFLSCPRPLILFGFFFSTLIFSLPRSSPDPLLLFSPSVLSLVFPLLPLSFELLLFPLLYHPYPLLCLTRPLILCYPCLTILLLYSVTILLPFSSITQPSSLPAFCHTHACLSVKLVPFFLFPVTHNGCSF